jgi:hypothetical protein
MVDLLHEHERTAFFDFHSHEIFGGEIFHVFLPLFTDLLVSLAFVYRFCILDSLVMVNMLNILLSQLTGVVHFVLLVVHFDVLAPGFVFS